ncbi:hypothetical protein MUY27_00920 [Mucilaginibacter sp. RS28]|uniref:Pentapeptide MXKDX repeat protein n=1 Tax=Mucilaginibacter straminoryzae TaxID=2932774 RepID=A0A9X2BBH0_9SPHI|nr:hypothetical protein [Mucilaginibacter straminoryzae]MCJ8208248.1 hypothetical protein [Mucilaginibacter straminoryzae]
MKKIICLLAVAAIGFSSVVAAPVKAFQTDTAKVKVKHKAHKTKIKKKRAVVKKDSSKM